MEDVNVLRKHYAATQDTAVPRLSNADVAVSHMLTKTAVSELFFSDLNVGVIQTAIARSVRAITGRTVGRQSDHELFLIMRSIYLQYSRNDPNAAVAEVRELNARVVEYCVEVVVANMTQYLRYMQEVGRVPVPQERAPMMTSAGTRSLALNAL